MTTTCLITRVRMEVYTFIDAETKKNIHIDSDALRRWCAERARRGELEAVWTPVDPKIAASFITDNSVSEKNLARVAALAEIDPIIYCKTGTYTPEGALDVILVDGHHRYYLCALGGAGETLAYLLEPEQWRPFMLDLPEISEEELRAIPPKGEKRI